MAGGFLPFQAPLVRAMRLPAISQPDAMELSDRAETCQEAANAGDNSQLQTLEAQIDQIVYRLFELTPEEIALIENSTQ